MYKVTCPYCDNKATLHINSGVVYGGRNFGPIYLCDSYPMCDSYVGCHPDTVKPLGRLANKELRKWKNTAHKYFDPLWKTGKINEIYPVYVQGGIRKKAYVWLSKQLGIKLDVTHIGMFDVDTCKEVVEICKYYCNEF